MAEFVEEEEFEIWLIGAIKNGLGRAIGEFGAGFDGDLGIIRLEFGNKALGGAGELIFRIGICHRGNSRGLQIQKVILLG